MTRAIRVIAWIVIVALAAFQAYAQRYAISPDGISYLDLSDAVVSGEWSHLVNLYWSPLYPVLIGLARLVARPGPATEVTVIHVLNFAAFVAMFAAFEYMLVSILSLAAITRRSMLAGPWALAGVYVLFACFALTMIPMELTTPDLLGGAAVFVAFGALLRLRGDSPHALVLGAALGVGALAKSFMIPWAIACFVTLALATRSRGLRATVTSIVVWIAIAGPWVAVLSHAAGRFTFGDTGRLTYVWYVNKQDAPSLGGVPPGARTARTEAILSGVGVVGDAPGTDPMWFDPARWNAPLKPQMSISDQLGTLRVFGRFYVQNLTPLLFIALLIAVAPRGSRRKAWWNGWVIYIPALAGVTAYAMVIVTARYIMPFVLGATLVLLATLSLPRRMLPLLAFLGIVIPIGLEAISDTTILGLVLVTSIVGGMVVGVFVKPGHTVLSRVLWAIAVVIGLLISRIIFPPYAPDILRIGAALLAVLFWLAARTAIRGWRSVQFAQRAELSLVLVLTIVFVLRLGLRLRQDAVAMERAGSAAWGNVQWNIARELASRGITPGTRIALVGPHAEAYWARTGRLRIVADVPSTRTKEFWQLPAAGRDSLLAEFAGAGATVAVASVGPETGTPDSTWTAVPFHGWIRKLAK